MPAPGKSPLPQNFPTPSYLTLTNWKRGVISLIDKSRLPKDALDEAENVLLVEDGQPAPRWGVNYIGTAPSASEIDGFDYFDLAGAIHLVVAAGGTIYRSLDDGQSWTACTGATYTAGNKVNMNQYNSNLYITNGVDNIILYDGTTVLNQYGPLTKPDAPTVAEVGTLGGSGYIYYYKIARVNDIGYSVASEVGAVSVQTNLARSDWTTTNYASVTTPVSVATQTRWDIYMSEDNINFYYLDSVASGTVGTTVVYSDFGTASVVPSTVAPTDSTAEGPLVKELVNVGSRMYGVGDTANPYRIWFTSGSAPYGAFAPGAGGGYLEWQPGGKYRPIHVEDYRDGKGTPVSTVWMDSADGQGSIIQMTLSDIEISGFTTTIPSAYKLPGSRGTPSSGSVVNVLNDYFFYNSQAIYNLGTRAQFLNLLSTDEASANIRPNVKQITASAETGIASVYFDAKVLFSVPRGSTTNNYTMVFDTERKAWLPSAFTIGFKKFLRYTTTNKVQKLLAIRPGDVQLSEISSGIQGDYGVPFTTSVTTGLYPTTKNRAEFQFTEQAEIELSQPQGSINVELLGTERSKGFKSNKSATIAPKTTPYGWDSLMWDTTMWDDTTNVGDTFSESSTWRYFTVQKELRNVQWRITTTSLDAYYILRTLQTWGTDTQSGFPRQERLN